MSAKSDALTELAVNALILFMVWYGSAPRPAPVPAFWFYVGKWSTELSDYARVQYMKAVERSYYHG